MFLAASSSLALVHEYTDADDRAARALADYCLDRLAMEALRSTVR